MKRYLVELEAGEREALEAITRKGSHRSQKVAQRAGSAQLRRGRVQRAARDRPGDRRGVADQRAQGGPGQEAVCGGRSGSGAWGPAGSSSEIPSQGGRGIRGAPRRAQLRRSARGARAVVAAPAGGPRGGTRLHRQRLARDGAARAKKNAIKPWRRVGWVIPPQRNADFAAGMERVLDVYRRPYDADFPVAHDSGRGAGPPTRLHQAPVGRWRRPVRLRDGSGSRWTSQFRRLLTPPETVP